MQPRLGATTRTSTQPCAGCTDQRWCYRKHNLRPPDSSKDERREAGKREAEKVEKT